MTIILWCTTEGKEATTATHFAFHFSYSSFNGAQKLFWRRYVWPTGLPSQEIGSQPSFPSPTPTCPLAGRPKWAVTTSFVWTGSTAAVRTLPLKLCNKTGIFANFNTKSWTIARCCECESVKRIFCHFLNLLPLGDAWMFVSTRSGDSENTLLLIIPSIGMAYNLN